jgi:hypothetical protein
MFQCVEINTVFHHTGIRNCMFNSSFEPRPQCSQPINIDFQIIKEAKNT